MSGPASPGQQVCTGKRARSTSPPSQTISWHGADFRSFGAICITCMNSGPRVLPRILQALRRLRLLQEREQLADFAQRGDRLLAHAQRDARRRAEQIAEHGNARAAARSAEALAASRTGARGRRPSGRDRRSRSSRAADRLRRGCASARRGARVARESRGGRRISFGAHRSWGRVDPMAQFTVASRGSVARRSSYRGRIAAQYEWRHAAARTAARTTRDSSARAA